jgi:hypothetical protein
MVAAPLEAVCIEDSVVAIDGKTGGAMAHIEHRHAKRQILEGQTTQRRGQRQEDEILELAVLRFDATGQIVGDHGGHPGEMHAEFEHLSADVDRVDDAQIVDIPLARRNGRPDMLARRKDVARRQVEHLFHVTFFDDFAFELDLAFADERLDVLTVDAAEQGIDLGARLFFGGGNGPFERHLGRAEILHDSL